MARFTPIDNTASDPDHTLEHQVLSGAIETATDLDGYEVQTWVDTEFGEHAELPEAPMLDHLSGPDRDRLAHRLAAAWVGNLSRQEGPDDELIDEAVAQLGFPGFIKLLSTTEGTPRLLAASLAASLFLEQNNQAIVSATRAKKKLLARAADEPYQDILRGDLIAAAESLAHTIENIYESVQDTMLYAKKNRTLLAKARSLKERIDPVRIRLNEARTA
jgi:hypothetical protein